MATVFEFLLFLTALFMIVLVLIQRGKGGGLAGAFGGKGGQSAFGTKAGDLFTRITIGVATFWILLCIATVLWFGQSKSSPLEGDIGGSAPPRDGFNAPATPGKEGQPPAEGAEKPAGTGSPASSSGQHEAPSTPAKGGS